MYRSGDEGSQQQEIMVVEEDKEEEHFELEMEEDDAIVFEEATEDRPQLVNKSSHPSN